MNKEINIDAIFEHANGAKKCLEISDTVTRAEQQMYLENAKNHLQWLVEKADDAIANVDGLLMLNTDDAVEGDEDDGGV